MKKTYWKPGDLTIYEVKLHLTDDKDVCEDYFCGDAYFLLKASHDGDKMQVNEENIDCCPPFSFEVALIDDDDLDKCVNYNATDEAEFNLIVDSIKSWLTKIESSEFSCEEAYYHLIHEFPMHEKFN